MPSNLDNIRIVVNLLKANNINDIVISPGGTNISLIKAVQDDPFFRCCSVVDERSAAYFAIGIYLQTGRPVALCCTSAQATRNYIPGLTEAFYKRVPLLALTMQKHPRFTYQEYMQAPDQTSLPADAVKASFLLPYISDDNDYYHSIRVVNQAILELTRNGLGPVQLSIPWLDFPLENPQYRIRRITRLEADDEWSLDLEGKRVLIAVGEHRPFTAQEIERMDEFCSRAGAVIYTNLLSNCHSAYCLATNFVLSTLSEQQFAKVAPDIVITIGGQTGDYPFYKMFSRSAFSATEHWRVAEDGRVVDTYDKLNKVFQCREQRFFEKACDLLAGYTTDNYSYQEQWRMLKDNISHDMELPFSNAALAQFLAPRIPKGSTVQLSILNSLRVWDLFEMDASIACFSNVGAFGIDGGMSTLIGQSFATDAMCFMVIGDLAFLYDMNAISIRGIRSNVRILLVNNNGGFEFKLETGSDKDTDRYIAAADHFRTAEGWAQDCGFQYLAARSIEEFRAATAIFLRDSTHPIILEAFVSDDDEYESYDRLMDANMVRSASDTLRHEIKKTLRRAIGPEGTQKVSGLIRAR